MFDLGIQELIVIFVVALIVFGPKKLPELGKTLGKGILELKKAMEGVKEQIHAESDKTVAHFQDIPKWDEKKNDVSAGTEITHADAEDYPEPSEKKEEANPDLRHSEMEKNSAAAGKTPEERKEDKVDG